MIKIVRALQQPIESYTYWSYPVDELDHILASAEEDGEDKTYLYFEGRLYEAPYMNNEEDYCDDEPEHEQYIRSSTNGDYSPSNPWDAPGCSINMFI